MPDAQLGKQCVDGANLHAALAAGSAQGCCGNVVLAIWLKQRKGSKSLDDLGPVPGAREPLQQFLKYQACRDDDLRTEQRVSELVDLWFGGFSIAAKRQRPNARVDQQGHLSRDRSAL